MEQIQKQRRALLKFAGASAAAALLDACGGGAGSGGAPASAPDSGSNPPMPTTAVTPATSGTSVTPASPQLTSLKAFLTARAIPSFALPAASATPPAISWAGPLTGSQPVATTLPNGVIYAASSSLIGGPIRSEFTNSLPGNPAIGGYPCLVVTRPFTCKGAARSVTSPSILRFKTDAPVVEITGVTTDGSQTCQTLIVDGQLVPPTLLCSSRGTGGWNGATIRIEFPGRQVRDIWVETEIDVAYVKVDRYDTFYSVDDASEPQITVVGDSYLQQRSAAFGNGGAIALELGARLGIGKVALDAIGGTGYWNSGLNNGNLNDRLPAHAADGSQIYLVMAGLNDYGDMLPGFVLSTPPVATYENAVLAYMQGLRAADPNAVIVVTAPFCPIPPMSDSSYVGDPNRLGGIGDFLFKAQVQKNAIQQVAGPWVYIDVLMGAGWLNSSGATGDVTNLQWFTGGTPGSGTTATYKPGNTHGGGGGGFGGIASIPIISGGRYSQAPELVASGGSGTGALVSCFLSSTGAISRVAVVVPGSGYTDSGLPTITIDPTYEIAPAALGTPTLIVGINPSGEYPLPSFAPPGVTPAMLNNIYDYLMPDMTHPSPPGVDYLSTRLAQNIYEAILAL